MFVILALVDVTFSR